MSKRKINNRRSAQTLTTRRMGPGSRPGRRLNMRLRSRDTMRPSVAIRSSLKNARAQGRPGARCTRGLVCVMHKKKRTRAYRFSGGNPTFPAQWLYGLLRALLGDRAFLPPSLADESANLTPASGRRDHTTSPYAFAPFVKSASASTASRRAFRDDREPPLLSGETGRFYPVICPIAKAKYF